jgi:hypothetical protein
MVHGLTGADHTPSPNPPRTRACPSHPRVEAVQAKSQVALVFRDLSSIALIRFLSPAATERRFGRTVFVEVETQAPQALIHFNWLRHVPNPEPSLLATLHRSGGEQ